MTASLNLLIKKGTNMKRIIIMFAVALVAPQMVQAQGTVYVSNLDQPSAGSIAVGSDSWVAGNFRTGTNSAGYVLNSVQLAMTDASGNPGGFTVMIYGSDNNPIGEMPGSSLGTLNGSANPSTADIYTYTPASSLTLSPGTFYYIVLTAGTSVANGAYEWSYDDAYSYNLIDRWGGGIAFHSNNGSLNSWRVSGGSSYHFPLYAINGTAVPEPGVCSLFALGGLGFLWHRRKTKAL
jgi:hypothetical protein